MKTAYKFFWTTHKWGGILLSLVLLNVAVTGFALLVKKQFAWIQPPTREGTPGGADAFIATGDLIATVLREQHADFQTLDDIDRIDFRPGKRVFKVRSQHHYTEMQVDAVSGKVLGIARRRSDWLEAMHDGSFFADWAHEALMPVTAGMLFFLTVSGLYLWLAPVLRKRRAERREARGPY